MKRFACLLIMVAALGCSQSTEAVKNEEVTERPPQPTFGDTGSSEEGASGAGGSSMAQ